MAADTCDWLYRTRDTLPGHTTPPRVQQESVAGNLQQNSAGICAPADEIVTNYNFYYVPLSTQSQVAGYIDIDSTLVQIQIRYLPTFNV